MVEESTGQVMTVMFTILQLSITKLLKMVLHYTSQEIIVTYLHPTSLIMSQAMTVEQYTGKDTTVLSMEVPLYAISVPVLEILQTQVPLKVVHFPLQVTM